MVEVQRYSEVTRLGNDRPLWRVVKNGKVLSDYFVRRWQAEAYAKAVEKGII